VHDFYEGDLNLECISTAYITLISKNNDPQTMNDYRPISLVSLPLKFITKLLANRLQKDIIPILHKNNMDLSKGKIFSCLGWTFEYLHICHQSKRPIIILQIDFEKEFDKVEYNAIIAMLEAKGFGHKWISMVKSTLYSASISVLLNGVARKKLAKGSETGGPLSRLLFVNTSELL
jgi:23S rRNA A2030 N6-methylase RlmJ